MKQKRLPIVVSLQICVLSARTCEIRIFGRREGDFCHAACIRWRRMYRGNERYSMLFVLTQRRTKNEESFIFYSGGTLSHVSYFRFREASLHKLITLIGECNALYYGEKS